MKEKNQTGTNILSVTCSPVFLPLEGKPERQPRKAIFPRQSGFFSAFESQALIYDCFWQQNKKSVLLLCPPPMNLEENWLKAKFCATGSGKILTAKFFKARSSMLVELVGAPDNCNEIEMEFAGSTYIIPVQKNLVEEFSDKKIIFSMNKNNSLTWIVEWARFHHLMHNADGVILYDNGSSDYNIGDISQALAQIEGLKKILVISWPHKFGAFDSGVLTNPYWAHFLQNSSFSHILRRFGAKAHSLLNLDIDELAAPVANSDIFEKAKNCPSGFHILEGRWVENVRSGKNLSSQPSHTDFNHVLIDPRHALNAKKWVLDPNRSWLNDLAMQPSWHKIKQMPKALVKLSTKGSYWHFKGINTNWKQQRTKETKPSILCQPSKEVKIMFKDYLERSKNLHRGKE